MTQSSGTPDLRAQRLAMEKLNFLAGRWVGQAWVFRGPGERVDLAQTETAEYRLDGLIMVIEGVGRTTSDGTAVIQAFGVVSYDDHGESYWMRAFNDGRFLETPVRLLQEGQGLTWGFTLGEVQTRSVMAINERGEWTERGELIIGSEPPRPFMELAVRRFPV